jgi:hypothetical protein
MDTEETAEAVMEMPPSAVLVTPAVPAGTSQHSWYKASVTVLLLSSSGVAEGTVASTCSTVYRGRQWWCPTSDCPPP